MKKYALIVLLLLFSSNTFAADPINSSIFGNVAIDGFDTVAYWTENKAVEGSKKYTYKWNGAKWRFSSQENMDLFKSNPEKYLPEYGGYCAWAMSDGRTASIEGEAFTFHNEKLYLNYNMKVMAEWRADKDLFIEQANIEYPKVID